MKNVVLKVLVIAVLFSITAMAQPYPSTLRIINTVQTAPNQFQFELWFKNTSAAPYELASFDIRLNYNKAIFADTAGKKLEYLASGLPVASIRPKINTNMNLVFQNTFTPARIYMSAGSLPGAGSGQILNSGDSVLVGRYQISCTNPFAVATTDLSLRAPAGGTPNCLFSIYAGTTNTAIQNDATFINDNANPTVPVELTTFRAEVEGREVKLNWETKTEVNTKAFEVEKRIISSSKSEDWKAVGEVTASGTSTTARKYNFSEQKLNSGKYSYRLKMMDNDGRYEYSKEVEVEVSLPKEYAVSQNYPNPFNPTTRIDYQLPFDSKVTLELYGITGERIATLISGDLSAGYYTADVNASSLNLASGVYIYRITAANPVGQNFVQVKKLMLTK